MFDEKLPFNRNPQKNEYGKYRFYCQYRWKLIGHMNHLSNNNSMKTAMNDMFLKQKRDIQMEAFVSHKTKCIAVNKVSQCKIKARCQHPGSRCQMLLQNKKAKTC